jgi:hypothetical protein
VHEGGLEAISKYFLVPLWKSPMANETSFLIAECPQFRVVILLECTIRKKTNLSISKYVVFGVFTIIDRIHIGIPLLTRGQIKKRKLILDSPYLLLLKKNSILKLIGLHMDT